MVCVESEAAIVNYVDATPVPLVNTSKDCGKVCGKVEPAKCPNSSPGALPRAEGWLRRWRGNGIEEDVCGARIDRFAPSKGKPNQDAGASFMHMTLENLIRMFAGGFILASLLLAHFHNAHWLWFTAFVGFNLLQSSMTGLCPLEMLLRKLGVGKGAAGGCR
jgi:hypothetical protein